MRLPGSPGTTSTVPPKASTSMASSVAPTAGASAWARRSAAARKACGVCTVTSAARSRVLVTRPDSSTALIVSLGGRPGTAPSAPPEVTAAMTASKRAGDAKGRAASCTTITSASSGTAARPQRTESARVAPPATTASTPWEAASGAPASAGTTRTTPAEEGRQAATAQSSTGRPPRGENCFIRPKRRPEPPATTIDHTGAMVRPGRSIRSVPRSGALRPSPRPR